MAAVAFTFAGVLLVLTLILIIGGIVHGDSEETGAGDTSTEVPLPSGTTTATTTSAGCGPFRSGSDGNDDSCTLFPGVCDDDSPGFLGNSAASSDVQGQFFCYNTPEGRFLAYDPAAPEAKGIVHQQLPNTVEDLKRDWMASSFEFGMECAECEGFQVPAAGMAIINDAGMLYGGGSSEAPPKCGGCQEEVITCLSSARSVRESCSAQPLSNGTQTGEEQQCALTNYQHPWILRNRNVMATNNKPGTGRYFYMVTIQGFPCKVPRGPDRILKLIHDFAQGFQGMLDIWRLKPACSGRCELVSGAVSAWMTYSVPVALSILAQLRAWASLKIDDLPGCVGNQAVLKFGGVSVTDNSVVCCPPPYTGGRCNQNYRLPDGWRERLTAGSDEEFAGWLASTLGDGIGQCDGCDFSGPNPQATMCEGGAFSYDSGECQPANYENYIPCSEAPSHEALV